MKVAQAKQLLQSGEATTVNDAARMTGISRSAFYKYRDSILLFQNMMVGRIITFQFRLQHQQGQLASLLAVFTEHEANIQTINSIMPTNGSALVTISAETQNLDISLEELLHQFSQLPGVMKAEILGG